MRWCLWYGDGTTVTDQDAAWDDAPGDDVQALAVWDAAGPTVTYGVDAYALPGVGAAKAGRWMPDPAWEALRRRVHEELTTWR